MAIEALSSLQAIGRLLLLEEWALLIVAHVKAATTTLVLLGVGVSAGCAGMPSQQRDVFVLSGSIATVPSARAGEISTYERDVQLFEGMGCVADSGFDDIAEGNQVLVKNASAEVVALGELGPGEFAFAQPINVPEEVDIYNVSVLGGDYYSCVFPFNLDNVPSGENFYSVEIGNVARGEVVFTEEELRAGIELDVR